MTTVRAAGRAATTRSALLSTAREVFAAAGYENAAVADVVAGAGASVGSLYHHFGGKADLFLALYDEYSHRQEERAAEAVRAARAAGARERMDLFVAGAGGYLEGCWLERDLTRLFLSGGGPAGFELAARRRYREWTVLNGSLLRTDLEDEPWGDALVLVLTTVMREAGHEVACCDDALAAEKLTADVLALIAKIGGP